MEGAGTRWNLSRHGVTIAALAADLDVTTRTIRRDLAALQEAGFPLFDERDEDGHVHWRLDGQVLKGLETGFTVPELCALYLSRNLLEAVAGTPFQPDLNHAFARLEKLLSPRLRQFLDRLPEVLSAKPGPRARDGDRTPKDAVAKLLEATLHHRVTSMRVLTRCRAAASKTTFFIHTVWNSPRARCICWPTFPRIRMSARLRSTASCRSRSKSRRSRRARSLADVFANSLGVNTGASCSCGD